ncbi:MAG TPA: ATP-binding protein, partial [Pilimelia sp.]|nr:ATP-binding protein [Pilimelia sp.]
MGSRRLVGRRDQLARLDEAVRLADAGEPQFVVFGGESGVGKTRLMEHVAERLESGGARVLRTRCVELGTQGLPLAPLTTALRQLVALLGAEALSRTLFGADALVRLLPEYADARPVEQDRARLFALFAGLLQRLGAAHPLVWIIDDLHWSDRSTRDLIGYLARALTGSRILVLTAYRDDYTERHHPLRPFL